MRVRTKRNDEVQERIPQDTFTKLGASMITNPMVAIFSVRDSVASRRVGEGTEGMTVAHLAALTPAGAREIIENHPQLQALESDNGIRVGDVAQETLIREMTLSRRA